jgi:lipopolysaccharide transport system ATP-binding protein
MSNNAIVAEGLGKKYWVSALSPGFKTWREGANDLAMTPFRVAGSLLGMRRRSDRPVDTTIWAIRDVSFEVPFGCALGIVGHNGAGKSTLVRVLSRITEPTEGRAVVNGRVGSLLEVSAGFHPELTGRENVFLNGAVLGMSAADVRRRFDEIVAFAGVETYLDTPVKRYSSGMSMRLAFSVAAHLEPEVLIVDEVLAVGDSGFHRQCLDKMTEAVKAGRTVLFISHNLAAVTQLCTQGLLLQKGRVIGQGTATQVVSQYLSSGRVAEGKSVIQTGSGDGRLEFATVSVAPIGKETSSQIDRDEGVEVVIEYDVRESISECQVGLELWNYSGICALSSGILDGEPRSRPVQTPGQHLMSCRIPSDYLRGGMYSISLEASTARDGVIAHASDALTFEVVDLSSPEAKLLEGENGAVRPLLQWTEVGEAARSEAVVAV